MEAKSTRGIAFKKGNPGKPKGAVNKTTGQIKEMILQALDGAGGVDYLQERAKDPRTAAAFLGLVGKVLPMQLTGEGGGPIRVAAVEWTVLDEVKS